MTEDELRQNNARLRTKINLVLGRHPELLDVLDEIALKRVSQGQAKTPLLERIQFNFHEWARAIVERRPDLGHVFDE